MNDSRQAYWAEALSAAIDALGDDPRFDSTTMGLPAWTLNRVANDLVVYAENLSMAFGQTDLTNPLEAELIETRKQLRVARKAADELPGTMAELESSERQVRRLQRELDEARDPYRRP